MWTQVSGPFLSVSHCMHYKGKRGNFIGNGSIIKKEKKQGGGSVRGGGEGEK